MARLKTRCIIEKSKANANLFKVWLPLGGEFAEPLEAIEGVVSVRQGSGGHFLMWLNPCYDRDEIMDEIKAVSDA